MARKYKKKFVVEMSAFPKPRPRVVRGRGRKGTRRTFMPPAYMKKRDEFKKMIGNFTIPKDKLYRLELYSFREIPKSWSKAKKAEYSGQWCEPTPDIDNMAGGIMDSLPWKSDDKAVVSLTAEKKWSDRPDGSPYCVVIIEEV